MTNDVDRKNTIRICFICDGYPPERKVGGIEAYTHDLAHGLVDRGHFVTVISQSDRLAQRTVEDDRGVRVIRLPVLSRGFVPRMIRYRLMLESEIRREIKHSKINLVETQDVGGHFLFGSFGVPIIVRMQGAHFVYFAISGRKVSRVAAFFEKRTLRMADHLVAVSDHIRRETLARAGLTSRKCELIYNAVNMDLFKPDPTTERDPNLILFVGRLSETKGAPYLFKALPAIFQAFPSARLRFIGKNPVDNTGEPASKALLAALPEQLLSRVDIVGEKPRGTLPAEYQKAGVAVFPSVVDANPFAVLEGMSCAAPTIFMSSGPGPETIEHGVDGLLCDTRDPNSIAVAVISMLGDPVRAQKMGQAARQHVERQFSIQHFLNRNESFFQDCIRQDQRKISSSSSIEYSQS
jgi:glycosyltransferase involved in cell wall biosynthesis